ncbi:MAG: PKD domain-containing protein [Saprospiraceae bacterium]|nr:PKD domain-containing protein [Saprospiraceae bacterium]
MARSLIIFTLFLIFTNVKSQNLPPKQAYPLTIKQIHSGHSLTDPLFGQPWPGQFVELITNLRGTWAGDDIGKSTIPGSPMSYRWNNSSGYPDAKININEFELLSITEVANMCYPGGNSASWYQDCIQDQRDIFSTWVNHAWNNGNNGAGASTLLWTNWINIDGSDGPFRLKLDTLGIEWEVRQDIANANKPTGATNVYIIPGHKMMARLYDDVIAGIVPGISNFNQFFSDNIHTNSLGDYAIAMIHYACIYNVSPVGLPNDLLPNPLPGQQIPSPALATYLQNMIWEVVTSYPRTGIYTSPVMAVIDTDVTSGITPLSVSFDGSQSINNGSGSLTYDWNFGDGSATLSGVQVNHTYYSQGNFTATLTVTDSNNNSHSATSIINVQPASNGNNCDYLLYEPFDYIQNIPLHQLDTGIGFGDVWQVQDNSVNLPGYQTKSLNLSYQDLQNTGVHASGGWQYRVSGRALNLDNNGPFGAYVGTSGNSIGSETTGQDLWFSMLMRKDVNDSDDVVVELHNQNIVTYPHAPNNDRIQVGYFGPSSDVGGQKRWSLGINNVVYPTSIPLVVGVEAFIVLQMQFNPTNTVINIYVNPSNLGNDGTNTPTFSHTSPAPLLFKSISYYGGSNYDKSAIDEIRMATTYACVAPDQDITFNSPPIAIINATPTTGMAPLTVAFDGIGSLNPAGGVLSYLWNFGDGTPSSSISNPTHIYSTGGGQSTATLTVTDINNNSHSTSVVITLLDENGRFPCLSSITAVSLAACNGTGGHLQIHTEANTTRTLTFNGIPIIPSSGNNYTNLMTGQYQLSVSGANGCSDQYTLHVPIDSSRCIGWQPAPCAMEIGTNLPGFADWEPHRAMRNFMKNTRGEAIPYTAACNCWSFDESTNSNIFSQMTFDIDGYPTSLPQSTSHGNILLRYFVSSEGRNMPSGQTYVLLYDGNGTIDLSGSLSNINQISGRIQFTLGGDGTFWFQLTQSTLGNHIRNIRVVRLADEFVDLNIQPFYQGFVDKIAPFSVIRYMDWQHTNNNPMVQWGDRPLLGRFTYGDARGVPYELIIQLANQTKKDIWICVPHAADNDFIVQMATLFKNQLDPDITIYIEYSNEVWNWIFSQANYNNDNRPFNLNYGRAMALKAKNTFDIWHSIFVGEECRVKRVLGIQAGFNYLNEQILAHLNQDDWDFGSPTHYFGLDHDNNGIPRLDLLGATATVNDVMQNAQNNFNSFKNLVKQDYRNIQVFGKEVITYEGGQHFVGNVFGSPYPYQQAMWDAQNSTLMYEMYDMMHDSIRKWGCKLASNFSLAGPQESVYGSWGVMEDIDIQPPYSTTAPKYQALLDNLPPSDCNNTLTWQGQVNNLWSERCNWNKSRLPNENTIVIVPNNIPHFPEVDMNDEIKMIKMATNAIITVLTGFQLIINGE